MSVSRVLSRPLIPAIMLILLTYFVLAWVFYAGLASRVLGANDFYSRWMGSRALFLNHEDPYSDEVTRQIQLGIYGRLARPDEDQVAFAYPLYAAFLALPFITLPYAMAESFWITLLTMLLVGAGILLAVNFDLPFTPLRFLGLVTFVLAFYPALRGIFLGQYALIVFAGFALGLYHLAKGNDKLAGALLALSAIKPHIALLGLAIVLGWAVWHRRWGLIGGLMATISVFVLTSALLLPSWLGEFIDAAGRYQAYIRIGPPVQVLNELIFPPALAGVMSALVTLVLFAGLVNKCVRALSASWSTFIPTVELALIVTTMVMIRTATTDQTLLLIPWIHWLSSWVRSGHGRLATAVAVTLLVFPWALFLSTLDGNQEAAIATTGPVLLTLFGYFAFYHSGWLPIEHVRADDNIAA